MYKWIVGFTLVLCLVSCADDSICDCLEAGDQLQTFSNDLLTKEGNVNAEDAAKLKELKEEKKKVCSTFERMGGEEMRKLQQNCEGAEDLDQSI